MKLFAVTEIVPDEVIGEPEIVIAPLAEETATESEEKTE